jgi:hypothetical protein
MAGIDQTIKLRAQQILNSSSGPMLIRDAILKALEESKYTTEQLREMLATVASTSMKGLKQRTFDLPEPTGQLSLFDIPQVIGITTPQGDLLIPKDQATLDEVGQWTREGLQHHETQALRFRRAKDDVALLDDLDGDIGWTEARKSLPERKREALEAGGIT